MGRDPREGSPADLRRRERSLVVGRLIAHGAAPYQFRVQEDTSYYMRLLTQRGERIFWGKDLERAIHHGSTQPQVGDMVGARRVGHDTVTVLARERAKDGRVLRQSEQLAHRNRWVVEKVTFFAERAKLARRVREEHLDARREVAERPELMSTFLTLRGAEELAARRIRDPKDRERFVALVREAMAGSIQKGEPLPTVRLRERRLRDQNVKENPSSPPDRQSSAAPSKPQPRTKNDERTR